MRVRVVVVHVDFLSALIFSMHIGVSSIACIANTCDYSMCLSFRPQEFPVRPQFSQRPRRLYGAELQPVTVLATLSLCTGTVCLRSWTLPSTMKLRMSLFSCCLQIMRM